MAEIDDSETKRKSRKLPPLKQEQEQNEENNVEEKKPRRKKKKTVNEGGEPSTPDAVGEEAETPRKKKRKPREPRDSSAGGNDPDETKDGETPRKKKRKKKPVGDQESPQSPDEPDGTVGQEGTEKLVKKRRKKRKTPREEVPEKEARFNEGLAAELHDMEDDVIDAGTHEGLADEEDEDNEPNKVSQKGMQSQAENALYIEKKHYFRREDKQKLAKRLAEEEERRRESANMVLQPSEDTLQFALATHRFFRKLSLICHGLLAGGALAHCVMVFMWILYEPYLDFLDIYAPMALPIHQIYYFLLLICTVSACDRFDLAGMTRAYLVKCITLQNGAVSAVVYLVTTIVSLSIVHHDDKIHYYTLNTSVWDDEPTSRTLLNEWSIVNAVRAGGAILGWLIIALQPSTDKLSSNLLTGDENLLGDDVELRRVAVA